MAAVGQAQDFSYLVQVCLWYRCVLRSEAVHEFGSCAAALTASSAL